MNVEVVEATHEETPILRRLLQLYLYDLGTSAGWDVRDDGHFGGEQWRERYWNDDRRSSFLIRVDGKLSGFVLIRDGSFFSGDDTREISEFFILRKYRRQGIGGRVATWIFDRFPGKWEVAEMSSNTEAQAFWRAVIRRYTCNRFEEFPKNHEGTTFVVQCFDNTASVPRCGRGEE